MKLRKLYDSLKELTQNRQSIFSHSGMVNRFDEMSYGFFPLGAGILIDEIKSGGIKPDNFEIEPGGIMILGNDFGTVTYTNGCGIIGEINGTTVRNLFNKRVGLTWQKTFFTNFHLGVRDDITYPGTTMRKRIVPLTNEYKTLCAEFLVMQLKLIAPKFVICLGHDVKDALIDSLGFTQWAPKSKSLKKLYEKQKHVIQDVSSKSTFVVVPHPCDSRNFNSFYIKELKDLLNGKYHLD